MKRIAKDSKKYSDSYVIKCLGEELAKPTHFSRSLSSLHSTINSLNGKRTPPWVSYSKTLSLIEAQWEESSLGKGCLLDQLPKLENGYAEITYLDSRILENLSRSWERSGDLESVINSTEKYFEKLITVRKIVNRILHNLKLKAFLRSLKTISLTTEVNSTCSQWFSLIKIKSVAEKPIF